MRFYTRSLKLGILTLLLFGGLWLAGCTRATSSAKKRDTSLVFIHIGKTLPSYVPTAISQARLFNPKIPIYLIANQEAFLDLPPALHSAKVICVSCESLSRSRLHKQFVRQFNTNRKFRNGFWLFTTERFFYLEELMRTHRLSHVFHLENDVMLYTDVKKLGSILKTHYSHRIAATFDNDERCIAGLIYIDQIAPLQQFLSFVVPRASQGGNDMEFLAQFKKRHHKTWIEQLPVIMPEYAQELPFVSQTGDQTETPELFSNHIEEFSALFDAAAIGQYLGGIDQFHTPLPSAGFINERCLFDPSRLQYDWVEDEEGRTVPRALYKGKAWKINNLHIHSKNLEAFRSVVKRGSSAPFLSGDTFRAIADHAYDELDSSLKPESVQTGDVVFVKTDYLNTFVQELHPKILHPYVLLTHNSDEAAPGPYHTLLQDDKILAWFAQNYDGYFHPKMRPIPIGLANRCWQHGDVELVRSVQAEVVPKHRLAYMNLNVATYPQERSEVYAHFLEKEFCYQKPPTAYAEYLHDVASSTFIISPRGNGLDTHRLWEALYLGSIPIVKSSSLDPLYRDLPVLIVEDWNEVTEEWLQKKKAERSSSGALRALYIDYWIEQLSLAAGKQL